MKDTIKMLKQDRKLIARSVENLSQEQLLLVPEGFKNNILWNLGHLIVTQQILHYKLSGNKMLITDELCDQLKSGTSPVDWSEPPDVDVLKALVPELPARLEKDYELGRFRDFKEYTTRTGIVLANIDDAISFNNFHEGVHTGVILCLKKLVV